MRSGRDPAPLNLSYRHRCRAGAAHMVAYPRLPGGRCIRAAVGWPMPENNFHVYLASSFLVGNSAVWASDVLFGPIAKWLGMARKPPP